MSFTSDRTSIKQAFIGTSGFSYPHWGKEIFYPNHLKSRDYLSYYSRCFNTVELNNTFYRLPKEDTLNRWCEETPPGFVFAVKGSRFITHIRRLKEPEANIRIFLERISILKQKLGPVLFQFPPSLALSVERLEDFLSFLRTQPIIPDLRVAIEIRHPSWMISQVFKLLEGANIALCLSDWSTLPVQAPLTADFVYVRRHGSTSLYSSCYSSEMLSADAQKITAWLREGRDVYVYFNNDACGYAVENALYLKRQLSDC
ncbi:MAG: DUF72 domain-containing protein [Fischerella sp.]|uniref:DUF72 domain-containing protein n=1 Tax=Fischerella sp. TaxID=1191 RepID=UPI0018202F7F|nr:DUF72 domain-containing protein [Fischerella sp.]NWF61968.1 DUF72 domain-containing protein [Fischerella sp.]